MRSSSQTVSIGFAFILAFAGPWPGVGGGADASPPPTEDSPGSSEGEATLEEHLDALLSQDFLADARVSVHAVDLETGKTVYAKDAALALNPASNVKLITTAAAMSQLGPEHRYATRVHVAQDSVSGGIVRGNIYLEGAGDPSLTTGELFELAEDLHAAGVDRITGKIIVDSSRFDHDGLPPGYDQKNEFASYRAPGGACSVNFNTYEVIARPEAAVGSRPHLAVSPPVRGIRIDNAAQMVEGRRVQLTVSVEADGEDTVVKVRGTMGIESAGSRYRYPVSDPSEYSGRVFELVLRQAGIKLPAKVVVKGGSVPHASRVIATHRSETVSVQARAINKLSNNFMAEQLLRTLAEEDGATADQALERLRDFTREIDMPQEGLRLGNGSGLYDNNEVASSQLTHLLGHMYADFRYRADYLASLAVMGTEGTLRKRLPESDARRYVRGKTGTLDGISALSGYAGAQGKTPVAFSIIINDLGRWETNKARRTQDAIAERLARHAAGRPQGPLPAPD